MSAKNRIKVAGLVIAVVGLVVTSIPGASAGVSQSLTPSVIVRFETGTAGQVVAEVSQLRGTVVRRNDAVNSMAVAIPPSRAAVLARHPNVITLSANAAVKFQANVWKADVDLGSL